MISIILQLFLKDSLDTEVVLLSVVKYAESVGCCLWQGDNGELVDLHVTISLVRTSEDESGVVSDNGHHEITICIPALTEALSSNPASSLGAAELRQMTAFVQFFQELETVVPRNY